MRRNHAGLSPSTIRGSDDGTTLHLPARRICSSVLADLLEIIGQYGVSERKSVLETKDNAGRTVLTIAIQELNLEAVTILIDEQPTLLDMTWGSTTETPLDTAIGLAAKQNPHANRILEIVKAIVERRRLATLWAHNNEGEAPYYCARKLESKGSDVCKTIT